ncbi:MAG: transcription termination/antitermination protein NusG [Phycisphaeraceae bacterium]
MGQEPMSVDPSHASGGVDERRWFVLHTRSRQEKSLAADLHAMAIEHYLPLVQSVRYYGRRKATVQMPLFPGYVFLYGSIDQAYTADRTRRVAQLIPVTDQARFEQEVEAIRLAQACGAELDPYPYLCEGTWVEVRAGPFKGLRGVVENKRRPDRLLLQVEVLGQGASLEIDAGLLVPLEPAAAAAAV